VSAGQGILQVVGKNRTAMKNTQLIENDFAVSVGQRSERGVKAENEDAIGIRIPGNALLATKGMVAAIADGVSTAEAGREASQTCIRNFLFDYYATPEAWSVKRSAQEVLTALNRWLYSQGRRFTDEHKGYISTFSVLIIKSCTAHIFHVGDTRVYRIRDGELELLTRDHATVVSEKKTYLARAMGMDVQLGVDYRTVDTLTGDQFLLTTDGVHDFLRESQLLALLASESDCESQCDAILQAALASGSNDNLSCQVVRVERLAQKSADELCRDLTALPFPPDLEKGMVLDGYEILDIIHASNRSQLYRVKDIKTATVLVI